MRDRKGIRLLFVWFCLILSGSTVAKKITESHKLRKESKELLEDAKRKVENEIEK